MRRTGAVFLLIGGLALSGCGSTSGTAGDTKPTEATQVTDATAALVAAAAKTQQQSYKNTIDMGDAGTIEGVMDPARKTGEFVMTASSDGKQIKTETRIVDGVNYTRLTLPDADIPGMDGTTWRKMSGAGGPGTLGSFDPGDTLESLKSAAEVSWAGDDGVTGSIDLTKAGQQLGMGAGDAARLTSPTVPFEAGFDDEGRLVRYALTLPGINPESPTKMTLTFSDFGIPVEVKAPSGAELATG